MEVAKNYIHILLANLLMLCLAIEDEICQLQVSHDIKFYWFEDHRFFFIPVST